MLKFNDKKGPKFPGGGDKILMILLTKESPDTPREFALRDEIPKG